MEKYSKKEIASIMIAGGFPGFSSGMFFIIIKDYETNLLESLWMISLLTVTIIGAIIYGREIVKNEGSSED